MGVGKKYRGSVEKSLMKYVEDRLRGRDDIDYGRIFITYSDGFDNEFIDRIEALVRDCGPFRQVYRTMAGCRQ